MSVQIIMPNLNGGKYIGEAIESVLSQTRQDWELYIMDGGSTDNSIEIINTFVDKRIYARQDKTNFPHRFNLASTYSKSTYISYLASDDRFRPKFLEENIRAMENGVDFVYNSYVDATNGVITMHPHYEYKPGLLLDVFYMGVFWLFKRSLWEEVRGIPEYTQTENIPFDYDFCLRCEEAGAKFKYLNNMLGWYRRHPESDTGRHDNQYLVDLGERAKARARQRRGL